MSVTLLVRGIGELTTNDTSIADGSGDADEQVLGLRRHAAFIVDEGRIAWVGDTAHAPAADSELDVGGAAVVPGFVDSHAHLVFAGDRAREFSARMRGASYSAGGIMTTVSATRAASDDELAANVGRLVAEMATQGTTTVEIKGGYGLTVRDETRALAIASRFTDETTFLGAHVVPPEYADDPAGYVDLVTGPMLSAAKEHARWIDVFCERGAFDAEQARAVLHAGAEAGLSPRVHANQLGPGMGVRVAAEAGAASADHCTFIDDGDVAALRDAGVVATLLPAVEFSTRSPYPPARKLLEAGVTVALSTDCNPGSGYSSSMPLCMALAVREMRMTPAEALWSATAGGAAALRRDDVGRLVPGSRADFAVLAAPSYLHLTYRPGVPLVAAVYRAGRAVS